MTCGTDMGGVWLQFMRGGGTKDDKNINFAGAMIGRKSQGIHILKRFHAWGRGGA